MDRSKEALGLAQVTSLGSRRTPMAPRTGRVVAIDPDGRLLVDFEGNGAGPLPARLLASVEWKSLAEAIGEQREVLVLFDGGDPLRPIVAGILASSIPQAAVAEAALFGLPEFAEVDGQRVLIEGKTRSSCAAGKRASRCGATGGSSSGASRSSRTPRAPIV
jgi:hypothetical protein